MKSSGSRPPGAAMFNMELLPVDEIPNDDDHIEILDSLPLGSISFLEDPYTTLDQRYGYDQICETPEKETSYWANIPRIGDAYTQAINRTLLTNQPYPGDDRYPNPHPLDTDSRFIISRGFRSPRHYQIYDARCDFVIKIPMQLLENCLFDLSGWYSKQRAKAT